MRVTRRRSIALGAAAIGVVAAGAGRAQEAAMAAGSYAVEGGEVVIHPVEHASLAMTLPGMVIYADPVGGAEKYRGLPAPALILVTHEHSDHFDPPTLEGIVGEGARLLTNPSVFDKLPAGLKARATAIGNGETTTAGAVTIDAIPAHNLTPDRMRYHPAGRDNGYVLTIGGKRFYIAGDTEPVPEMLALEAIDVAFVPMNLPYTMSVEQAAPAVAAFAPAFVYPYHYGDSDVDVFTRLLAESGAPTHVVRAEWYPT
jgi:L-ascorbate metabolism protein UlaG (beta-lactamase superfamily)